MALLVRGNSTRDGCDKWGLLRTVSPHPGASRVLCYDVRGGVGAGRFSQTIRTMLSTRRVNSPADAPSEFYTTWGLPVRRQAFPLSHHHPRNGVETEVSHSMTFSSNPTRPIVVHPIRRGSNLTQEGVIRFVHIGVNRLASLDCEHYAWVHSQLIARHCCTAQGDSTSASSLSQQEPEVLLCVLVDFNVSPSESLMDTQERTRFCNSVSCGFPPPLRYHTARPSSVTSSWPGSLSRHRIAALGHEAGPIQ
ncbi:hypothetical protein BC826DRAFT_167326 [Russula brevipes]|nr:hypothetical protein BC826DRAFT_167326 [Russula brevipes]